MTEESGGDRERKILAGEGMVTPVRPFTVTENGKDERLFPGRSRFDPAHRWVQERPELFELAMPKGDRTDAPMRFRQALRAADRSIERQKEQLRDEPLGGEESWRL